MPAVLVRLGLHAVLVLALWLAFGVAAAAELPTYQVVAKGGRLSPARLDVPAGQRLKLVIRNDGPGPIEFENLDLRVEKVLAEGATSFVVTPPLKPGSHIFADEFHAATGSMQLIAK